jgi:hypothetical protein
MTEARMLTPERLHELLAAIPGVERVLVQEDEGKLVARVVAARYEGLDDTERAEEIYQLFLDELDTDERRRIAFVFTDTPREYEESIAGSE